MTSPMRAIPTASSPLRGTVQVPGSKSVSNRALLLAGLARGTSRLHGVLQSDDTRAMIAALVTLGVVVRCDGDTLEIDGVSGRFPSGGMIDVGHGGTPARFLLAAACLAAEPVHLDGSARLRQRPMAEGIEAMRSLGGSIDELEEPGHLPLKVSPSVPAGVLVRFNSTASSQFISAMMLIGAALPGGLTLEFTGQVTSSSYVRLTAHELEYWGVGVEVDTAGEHITAVRIRPGMIAGRERTIPPDASSLVYWATAAGIVPGSDVLLAGVSEEDQQPDLGVLSALSSAGVDITWSAAGARVRAARTFEGWRSIDASSMPDGSMALAVAAACGTRVTTLTGLQTLRVKETDRIEAMQSELERAGADVRSDHDSLRIHPLSADLLSGDAPLVEIETYDDHRMAMAFAVLGLRRGGICIKDPSCVTKSYPRFWDDLDELVDARQEYPVS